MATARTDPRLELVARLLAACSEEVAARDPAAAIPWPTVPTVAAMLGHLGGVHRWVTEILRTRSAVAQRTSPDPPPATARAWFDAGAATLLEALAAVPAETPCWVLGGRTGTAAFWRRRMVFEHVKHLIDLRASGGGAWAAAPELRPADYADGIDELLGEFLPRSRDALRPLPGAVALQATDSGRAWRIEPDWRVGGEHVAGRSATITACTADLALVLWERADPLEGGSRFRIEGDRAAVSALRDAAIHPW